jgi:hypothetical protein
MNTQQVTIGQEVINTYSSWTVGRIGIVTKIDSEKNKVKVDWIKAGYFKNDDLGSGWISIKNVAPSNIPYKIEWKKGAVLPSYFQI